MGEERGRRQANPLGIRIGVGKKVGVGGGPVNGGPVNGGSVNGGHVDGGLAIEAVNEGQTIGRFLCTNRLRGTVQGTVQEHCFLQGMPVHLSRATFHSSEGGIWQHGYRFILSFYYMALLLNTIRDDVLAWKSRCRGHTVSQREDAQGLPLPRG